MTVKATSSPPATESAVHPPASHFYLRPTHEHCQVCSGVSHLLLCGLRSEHLVQFKGHNLALVGEVEDGVVIGVEAQHGLGICGILLLLIDRPHTAENTDVAWETESMRQ